jgi:nitrogen fixation/metabolism regulation signal transduction histidine kinase
LPIGRAVVVAERIARGDLTSAIEVRIHDETGRLLDAIAAMQERLRPGGRDQPGGRFHPHGQLGSGVNPT